MPSKPIQFYATKQRAFFCVNCNHFKFQECVMEQVNAFCVT